MSDFEDKLKQAIDRGRQRSQRALDEEAQEKADAERLKRLHTAYRLSISEHIEKVVHQLADHFPGFRYETVYGDTGWGAACWSDQLNLKAGQRASNYSRFEIAIKPINQYLVLDLQARGTIFNRELLTRSHFAQLDDVDQAHFEKLVDAWALAFAEQYAAKQRG